jgi:Ser/Thr protein kinase RdoA (MazF antagonist)
LVNTAKGQERTLPVDHEHHSIERIEYNPWENIDYERLEIAKASEAFKIKTRNQSYVMKRIPNSTVVDMKFQQYISNYVNAEEELLSRVLYWGMKDGRVIQVLRYLPGNHRYGRLGDDEVRKVVSTLHKLSRRLSMVSNGFHIPTLREIIEAHLSEISDSPARQIGIELLGNETYQNLTSQSDEVLVHFDTHRSNILFSDDGSQVKMLDLGSFCYAHPYYQPASFFMSCLLFEEMDDFDLDRALNLWGEKITKKEMAVLMQARALAGASFFQKRIEGKNISPDDIDFYEKYLKSMQIISKLGEL